MSNIFFPKRKKKRLSFKIIIFGGLFFCFLAALVYFSIWSSILRINEIEIKSEKEPVYYKNSEIIKIAEEKLKNKFFGIIPQNTIILAPVNEIKNAVLDIFPEIGQINIYRNSPDFFNLSEFFSNIRLTINIEERESIGIWCKFEEIELNEGSPQNSSSSKELLFEGLPSKERKINECFQIDKDGVIYRKSLLVKSNSVLNIYSSRNQLAEIRDSVVPFKIINFILEVKEKVKKIKTDNISSVLISNFDFISIEDLRGTTSLGWQVYFNPADSIDSQIRSLETVLSEQIKQDHKFLEYIDLRIEGRVYYK